MKFKFKWHRFVVLDLWRLFGMGNTARLHSSAQRFETHWLKRVQCADHVHHGCCHCISACWSTWCRLHSDLRVYHLLYNSNIVFGVCAKGIHIYKTLLLVRCIWLTRAFFPSWNKLVEMKRNPQGAVDKRIRATLRPMSKNRRDSSACELEQRLRDVKTNNCRFRKALLEKEAELQVGFTVELLTTNSVHATARTVCGNFSHSNPCNRRWYGNWDRRHVLGSITWIVTQNRCSIDRRCRCQLFAVKCPVPPMQPIWHRSVVWHRRMTRSILPRSPMVKREYLIWN